MAQQIIDTVTDHGTYKGDPAKIAFEKSNGNFSELYLRSKKNLLINARMRVNLRKTFTGGALAANVYGYDRFKAGAGGCSISADQVTGVVTHSAGSIVQVIEDARIAGRTVCFSVEDPTAAISVTVAGVSGTIAAGVGRRGVALAVPEGATGNVSASWSATGATYRLPQLEVGDAPSSFEWTDIATDIALCERYCQAFTWDAGSAFAMALVLDASTGIAWLDFPTMRITPTARIIGGLQMTGGGPVSSPAAPTLLPSSPANMAMLLVVQGKTPGAAGYFNPSAGGATIILEAEL